MSFDPNTFLNTTYEEANDTKITPCPVGEYLAVASKVDAKTWASRDGSKSGVKLEILWEIDDANVKQLLGRDKVTSRQNIMLDLNEAGTGLDLGKGKNVGLGRLREALDLNTPGQSFAFSMIEGRLAKVMVSHRVDGEDIYDEVKKVAKPA
mgnify:CR=1 FL=1